MKGQLRSDGSLGKVSGYCFVDATTVIDRLIKDGSTDVSLSIRPKYGDEQNVLKGNRKAIEWVNEHPDYVYEAYYSGFDELLHVTAMEG